VNKGVEEQRKAKRERNKKKEYKRDKRQGRTGSKTYR
jgi:hypothetical protein